MSQLGQSVSEEVTISSTAGTDPARLRRSIDRFVLEGP